jgi:beta-galactosidase
MRKTCISKDWYLSAPGTGGRIHIDLPNDYSITQPRDPNAPGGGRNGFFLGGTGYYTKFFTPEEGKHHILNVDGAYACTEYMLNHDWIGKHPHGYTPFLLDLTDHLRPGMTNKLEITTNDMQPSTRWYSGAGIYRDVFMWTGGDVRVEPWDAFITTPVVEETSAKVQVAYTVSADRDTTITLMAEVHNAKGKAVAKKSVSLDVVAGKNDVTVTLTVRKPHLWDMDDPYLYTLYTTITEGDVLLDEAENTFGIRTITVDTEHGFCLNGKTRKLRGGCIHHDHGVLGAACYPAAEERKLRLLKEAGFNALRIAHNPPSLALLDLCDRMGIIVMDEAFDMWNRPKTQQDYHLFFGEWWAHDIACMVKRDRNHPCVFTYSIGNEISERDGNSDGISWARKLVAEIRRYDSTRFVTSGIHNPYNPPSPIDPKDYAAYYAERFPNNSWEKRTEKYMAELDVVGYNYQYNNYESDHALYPDRVMWGSETHTLRFFDSWHEVSRLPWVMGDFTWTAYDNLGEAGAGRFAWARDGHIPGISIAGWPWRTCYQGDLDLCGYRRPQAYFREAIWIGGKEPRIFTTHPEHVGEGFSGTGWHFYDVHETWTFDDAYIGKPVKAEVYTDADEIEWILNGNSLGRTAPEKAIASIEIPYEKGEITAVAYKGGVECSRYSLRTVGKPTALRLTPEKKMLSADNRDLCYLQVEIVDERGDRVTEAKHELTCLVEGGELMGIFSGDPCNTDQYGSPHCHAFDGRALIIVRAAKPGRVTVTVGHNGLKTAQATVTAK